MKTMTIVGFIASFFISATVFADTNIELQNKRIETIKEYVKLLGQGEYKKLPELFTHDAVAVSSSGISDNPVHFYETLFTKTISHPKSSLINVFDGKIDSNMLVGYFDYSWKNIEKKNVSAKFLDLFVFQQGSTKISKIYVFSNTFQEDIMKQLQ